MKYFDPLLATLINYFQEQHQQDFLSNLYFAPELPPPLLKQTRQHFPSISGVVNLGRVEVLWRPVTNHLLDVCQHPHVRMREWGVEAVTYLVKAALTHKHNPPLKDNQVHRDWFIYYTCSIKYVT